MTCEVYLSTPPVGYTGSTSTVNETNCNIKKNHFKNLMRSFPIHSDLSHHDVLEEGCHLLFCSGEMGSSTFSPDSWCRRFLIETAARKSDRSFIGPFFAWLIQCEIPLSLVSLKFLCIEMVRVIFFRKFVHLFALLFWPSDCELWFTMNWISGKSIVNTCKMFTLGVDFLTASLPRIPSHVVFSLYFLADSSTISFELLLNGL